MLKHSLIFIIHFKYIGALPDEASIHKVKMTAIKTALSEIKKKEDEKWEYTHSLSSMKAIEHNKGNHLVLNQIYDSLAELHNRENKS